MITPRIGRLLVVVTATAAVGSTAIGCPEDLNGDGSVGFADLTQLLNNWGPCGQCFEDFDGDGSVGFADLTRMLAAFGPCADTYACTVPFANGEIQQIGLEALGPDANIDLPAALYDRILQDITAIRTQFNLEGYLHQCRWVGREMLVGIDPKGPLEDYEAMNAFWCANVLDSFFGGSIVYLSFPCDVNIPALAAMYEAQTEVNYAEPNGIVGGGASLWTPTALDPEVWAWSLNIGFLDCFDGCDCRKEFTFITTPTDPPLLVDETPVMGLPYCPEEVPGPPSQEVQDSWAALCNYANQ